MKKNENYNNKREKQMRKKFNIIKLLIQIKYAYSSCLTFSSINLEFDPIDHYPLIVSRAAD